MFVNRYENHYLILFPLNCYKRQLCLVYRNLYSGFSVEYWYWIWWKSLISRYINFVKWHQNQPPMNSAKWAKIDYFYIGVCFSRCQHHAWNDSSEEHSNAVWKSSTVMHANWIQKCPWNNCALTRYTFCDLGYKIMAKLLSAIFVIVGSSHNFTEEVKFLCLASANHSAVRSA